MPAASDVDGVAVGNRANQASVGQWPCWRAALMLAAALAVSGCVSTGAPGPVAAAPPTAPTVAFESIEGPPETIFRRLVQNLSDEATARQVTVVSRDSPAQYRIRSYLAAITHGKKSTVSWVWDVYDADRRRALRISGEEPAGQGPRGSWAAIDDQVLRRIARSGMERLGAFLAGGPPEPGLPPPPAPASRGPAVAALDPSEPAQAYASLARP